MKTPRRAFITLLGGATVAWPFATRAQQLKMPVVGYLSAGMTESNKEWLTAFRQGLSESGFVEGFEYRWGDDHYERGPELMADLVRRQVAVIATTIGVDLAKHIFQVHGVDADSHDGINREQVESYSVGHSGIFLPPDDQRFYVAASYATREMLNEQFGCKTDLELHGRRFCARGQMLAFFGGLPRCVIGLEACATAHCWTPRVGCAWP